MDTLSLHNKNGRYILRITFRNEEKMRTGLTDITRAFSQTMPTHCMLTDLDTDCELYKAYFEGDDYFVCEQMTNTAIIAYNISQNSIQNIISNWGYYTVSAILAFGAVKVARHTSVGELSGELLCMPILISQVLDNSLDICFKDRQAAHTIATWVIDSIDSQR